MDRYIQIHPKDNVAVALADLPAGEVLHLSGRDVTLREAIPVGHKIALADLNEQDQVIKYGYPIGHVRRRVQSGDLDSSDCRLCQWCSQSFGRAVAERNRRKRCGRYSGVSA